MIVDRNEVTGSWAMFSADRAYRYALHWPFVSDDTSPAIVWCMLNPSTADAFRLDPTLRRCAKFSVRWGFRRMTVVNAFAFRATDPADMIAAADPVGGPIVDAVIRGACCEAGLVVVGWGVHGAHLERGRRVLEIVRSAGKVPHALGFTKDGNPRHPLYMRADSRALPIEASK